MVESEAQGRLPGIAPVSVVDIGSNSIRLVVYEGMSRSPTVLFNEKSSVALAKASLLPARWTRRASPGSDGAAPFQGFVRPGPRSPFMSWRRPPRARRATALISSIRRKPILQPQGPRALR